MRRPQNVVLWEFGVALPVRFQQREHTTQNGESANRCEGTAHTTNGCGFGAHRYLLGEVGHRCAIGTTFLP